MLKLYKKLVSAITLLIVCGLFTSAEVFGQATPLVVYSFTGAAGNEDSLAADAQPTNAKFSKTGRAGTGVVGTTASNVYNSTGFASTTTVDLTKYISFSGTPFTNYKLNLTGLEIFVQRSGTGPKTVELRSSADNYASVISTIDLSTLANKTETITFPSSYANLPSRTEFRLYPYNGATTGTFRIDNLKISGTVDALTASGPTVNFAAATSSVTENVTGGTLSIPVTITNPSATVPTTVTVAIATTSPGTATVATDYTITTGTLTFPAGSSANQNAILTIVNDALVEGNETINLILTAASSGATIGATSTHTVTIVDDEVAPTLSFGTPTTKTVQENAGAVTIPVVLSAASTSPVTVQVALATPAGTGTAGTDYTFSTQTLTFAAGSTTQNATITIINDKLIEAKETVNLMLQTPTGANLSTTNNTYTITIVSDDVVPIYTVAQVTTNNTTTFAADSLGKKVSLHGTLYGDNQRTGGAQFTLIDATGGIGIFINTLPTTGTAFPANLAEGDSVQVWGSVDQFNALTQIALDSVKRISTNHMLRGSKLVNGPLTEAHESELVRLAKPVTLVTPSQWKTTGTTAFNVDVTDGTNTYQMRIVPTSNIFGTAAPTGQFVVTGIGGQFDNATPFDTGYQLLPRRLSDLRNVTGLSEELNAATTIYPNPVAEKLNVTVAFSAEKVTGIRIFNTLGQEVAKVAGSASEINVANLPAGIYSVKISTENASATKRFVKAN